MKIRTILLSGLSLITLGTYTSCTDMMDTTSTMVMYSKDNTLDQATDTVYSVMGIISKIQLLADQTVLLGEIRGDLTELTPQASSDLLELAQLNVSKDNKYNSPEKYYAIINNCNYFLAHADTTLKKRNESVFLKEFAAVKTFRAWTYLQLATTYGSVPFITEPVLTEAAAKKDYPKYDIKQICDYFINDLAPYVDVPFPGYGSVGTLDSKKFYLPTRVVLGDLCLWGERYTEAAKFYHDYLADENNPVPIGQFFISWPALSSSFEYTSDSYLSAFISSASKELVSYAPMETKATEAGYSGLGDIFNSTSQNYYYFKTKPSSKLLELSKAQSNCIVYTTGSKRDTLYAPTKNEIKPLLVGDLRLSSIYSTGLYSLTLGTTGEIVVNPTTGSLYSSNRQQIYKFLSGNVSLYRVGLIYLRYAEALNRAGFPESAFAILKYGLYPASVAAHINAKERSAAGNLIAFSQYAFDEKNTMGVHSRGSGNATANNTYVIPASASIADSINDVEELISNEMALETSFEGYRFYDLVRMAQHRNDPAWLANKIAGRKGTANYDANMFETLKNDKTKWFLPLN